MEQPTKRSLLVVEGDYLRQAAYRKILDPSFTQIFCAETIAAGRALVEQHAHELGLVILGICQAVPNEEPDTVPLIQMLRKSGFSGPIVGTSDYRNHRRAFKQTGCTHWPVPTSVVRVVQWILSQGSPDG